VLYDILKPLAVAFMRLYFRIEIRGREHVPRQGPVLLVANHSSALDPPIVGGACPRRLCFLAKAQLFDIPLFGTLIRSLNARPLRRDGADAGAMRTALRLLQDGSALLVFPEGTRGPEGTLRNPKAGAAMLAVLAGVPVVPAFISGSGRALAKGRRLPRPVKVRVTFGPPLVFERPPEGRKEYYEAVSRRMMAAIARLRDAATGECRTVSRMKKQDVETAGRA
jgi:1-acyl-sn-glycerol-3-phosphate acyltransferase